MMADYSLVLADIQPSYRQEKMITLNKVKEEDIFIETFSKEKREYINIKKRRTKKFEKALNAEQLARVDRMLVLELSKKENKISWFESIELEALEKEQTEGEREYIRVLEDEVDSYFS